MRKDAGILVFQDEKLLFRMDQGEDIRIAETAQLPDHSDPNLANLLGQRVTLLWTEVIEADNTPRVMAHRVVRHQAIADRAFEISQSRQGGTMVDNWLQAEDELLDPR